MDDLLKQIPSLRKIFYDYPDYADATMVNLFSASQLSYSRILKANTFETIFLQNTGEGFRLKKLPVEAQYAPVYSIVSADVNQDGYNDLVLMGNNKFNRIRLGRDDANHGIVLINDGKSEFTNLSPRQSGITIRGDVRSAVICGNQLLAGLNNDSLKVFRLNKP